MIDINKYRKILIINDYSSKKLAENLFNSFKSYLDDDFIFKENTTFDAIELINYDKSLCLISAFDYENANNKVHFQQDLILFINHNKIEKYKDRYFLNVNIIHNEIRHYKLNKILK